MELILEVEPSQMVDQMEVDDQVPVIHGKLQQVEDGLVMVEEDTVVVNMLFLEERV